MSNQKYCCQCGWAVFDDKPCKQCGAPSLMERQTRAFERIADAVEEMVYPVMGEYEEPDLTRVYND